LTCGQPSTEQQYADWFANHEVGLVVYLASGAADVLSVRNIDVSDGVAQMVARATEIHEQDLNVMRQRA